LTGPNLNGIVEARIDVKDKDQWPPVELGSITGLDMVGQTAAQSSTSI
jgi:hypothetical protein